MRTFSSVALAATLLAAGLTAQLPNGVVAGESTAWSQFVAEHGSGWRVDWNKSTGTPEAVWGPGLDLGAGPLVDVNAARPHAEATLRRFADLLKTGDSTFVEVIGEKVERVNIFVYQQRFRGLDVIDGRADVRIHDNGVLSLFGTQAFQLGKSFSTDPAIAKHEARLIALGQLEIEQEIALVPQVDRDRLVVWADSLKNNSPVRLAWEIRVSAPDQRKIGRAYVDAKTGAFIQYRTDLHECFHNGCEHADRQVAQAKADLEGFHVEVIPDPNPNPNSLVVGGKVQAWTNRTIGATGPLTNAPMRNFAVGSTFTDANGDFTLPGSSATVTLTFRGRYAGAQTLVQGTKFTRTVTLTGTSNTIQVYTSGVGAQDFAQSSIYYWLNGAMEFIIGEIGNRTQLTRLKGVTARVNVNSSCNATYSGYNTNFYNESTTCNNTGFSSVVVHEWGHGLDDSFGGIARGQMQEGLADTVSLMMLDSPIIGDKFFKARTPNYVRIGTNTKTWPPTGGVHAQGEVWMGFCWDAKLELQTALGSAAGLAQMRKLFSGVFVPDPRTQQAAAREVALLDDNDGNLNNGTPNCVAILRALTKRRIPNPISGCAGGPSPGRYTTFGMGCPGSGQGGGGPICGGANTMGGTLRALSRQPNRFAMEVTATTSTRTIRGCQVFTRIVTGTSASASVSLHLQDSAGKPQPNPVRTGSMNITGATAGWHSLVFSSPVTLPAGQKCFIVYGGPTQLNTNLPALAAGPRPNYYWRRPGTLPWAGPFTALSWSFRINCGGGGGGGAVPVLSNQGVPEITKSFDLRIAAAKATAPALFTFGASRTQWGAFGLPLDLSPFGASGCSVLASIDAAVSVNTTATGNASTTVNVPNIPALVGGKFYNQGLIFDSHNSLGVVVTNGGEGTVGRP